MVRLGFLERVADPVDRRRVALRLTGLGERIMSRAREESAEMEAELRSRFGDEAVATLRELLASFVVQHGGGAELAANRARATERA
jgi:DNA-binding MarR family transcriptional regulator